MPRFTDTIAALATPVGESAIAVIRVSGPDTLILAGQIAGGRLPPPRSLHRADYHDRRDELIDDVLWVWFRAPNSYTGEDTLEISCHGSPFIAQRILDDLFARGCRPAEPGAFTQRAFLNGRMDLSQAEAVMDLIHARSERSLAAANQQLRGSLGRRMRGLLDQLLDVLARVEAYIDFPDEDLPAEDRDIVLSKIMAIQEGAAQLLATRRYGDLLRDGVKTVIAGAPNVGKSSLLNRLVGSDRVLVSPEPGTTRDYVEEKIVLGTHCIRLIDTAGLNSVPAPLEKRGIEKSFECLDRSDIIIAVIDTSIGSSTLPRDLQLRLDPVKSILVLNKADLIGAAPELPPELESLTRVTFSAKTGAGLGELVATICGVADRLHPATDGELIAINARHANALEEAQNALTRARLNLLDSAATELLASDLRTALRALEEIAGKVDNEQVLDRLFATFCIGK